MKILIVTVAGMSTRFSKSVGKEVIKCLYNESDFSDSLISRLINQPCEYDRYIIVGGYRYNELVPSLKENFSSLSDKIDFVENPFYEEYGSGYSLYYGIKKALSYNFDELVFAEGDLFVDSESYKKVWNSEKSVITCNNEPIEANKAVAYYFSLDNKVHYIYDTGHSALTISEPFLSIYNSGQIWKFSDYNKVKEVYDDMEETLWQGTNLVFIEKYFNSINHNDTEIIKFSEWINCNTVEDFRKIKE